MFRVILRDLWRQPSRTILTVLGIAIGIFALVVLGALAEHFRAVVDGAKSYVGGTIRIVTKTNAKGENPGITAEDVATIRTVSGVTAVTKTITLLFDGYNLDDDPLIFLSPRPLVEGLPPELAERMRPGVKLVAGRWLKEGDDGKVMVVDWLARRRSWELGKKIPVRRREYEIVGIFDAPDIAVVPAGIVPFENLRKGIVNPDVEFAKKFFAQQRKNTDNPAAKLAIIQLELMAEAFVASQDERYYVHEVVPVDPSPASIQGLAQELKARLPHTSVIEPEKLAKQMETAVAIFLALTALVSVISSIVGGLLIVNTMAMAVVERRREIAIKVAIGASAWQVASEFVLEAAAIGLVGATLGTLGGIGATLVLDPWIMAKVEVGNSLFRVTPSLIAGVVVYGVGLGVIAGLIPALRAARTDPAPGLREL